MDLKGVGEADHDDDGETRDGGRDRGGVLGDDVADDVIAVGEVAGDGDEDVDGCGGADGGDDDGGGADVGGVFDLVEDGEHLQGKSG